jgi:hypothetical protein
VAFIHRFGSSLNEHTPFHVVVIDGVFEPDPEQGVRFIEVEELEADDAEAVQSQVRRRIVRAFVRRGLLEKSAGSGFSRKPPGKGASPRDGASKKKIARRWRRGTTAAASR